MSKFHGFRKLDYVIVNGHGNEVFVIGDTDDVSVFIIDLGWFTLEQVTSIPKKYGDCINTKMFLDDAVYQEIIK